MFRVCLGTRVWQSSQAINNKYNKLKHMTLNVNKNKQRLKCQKCVVTKEKFIVCAWMESAPITKSYDLEL